MLTVLTLGVLASAAAELVTWINKKLSGSLLKGDGAFLVAGAAALIGSIVKVYMSGIPVTDLHTLWLSFVQIWAVSQVFFIAVVQTLGLDVQPNKS